MTVIEGHAEHVMDACAAELGPGLAELRRRLDERRARRGGLGDLIARLLGMDLKLRQYELGKALLRRVVDEAGPRRAAARSGARRPTCPTSTELEAPLALARAGRARSSLAARCNPSSATPVYKHLFALLELNILRSKEVRNNDPPEGLR